MEADKEWIASEINALEETLPSDQHPQAQQELFARLMERDPDLATRYRKAYMHPGGDEVYKQQQRFVKREAFMSGAWNRLLYSKDRKPGDKVPTNWKVAGWLGGGALAAILFVGALLGFQERAQALEQRNDTIADLSANLVQDLPKVPFKYNNLLVLASGKPAAEPASQVDIPQWDAATTSSPRLPAGPANRGGSSAGAADTSAVATAGDPALPAPPPAGGGTLPLPEYSAATPQMFSVSSTPPATSAARLFTPSGRVAAAPGSPRLFQTSSQAQVQSVAPKLYAFGQPVADPAPATPAPTSAAPDPDSRPASPDDAAVETKSGEAAEPALFPDGAAPSAPEQPAAPAPASTDPAPSAPKLYTPTGSNAPARAAGYLFGSQSQPQVGAQGGSGQSDPAETAEPVAATEPLSPDAAQLLGVTIMPGDVFPARLVLGINVADGSQVPVVAETLPQYCATPLRCPQMRFIGVASIDSGNYVTVEFRSLIVDATAVPFVGVAADLNYDTALQGTIIQEAPAAIPDVIRGSIGGFSDYLQALQNQKSVTVLENGTVIENRDVGSLENYLLGAAAETFALPANTTAVVRRVQIPAGTPIQVVAGSVIGDTPPPSSP